jgi:hypothetical protein
MILGAVIVWAGLIVLILLWIAYDERRLKRQVRRTREEREQKEMAQFSLHQRSGGNLLRLKMMSLKN